MRLGSVGSFLMDVSQAMRVQNKKSNIFSRAREENAQLPQRCRGRSIDSLRAPTENPLAQSIGSMNLFVWPIFRPEVSGSIFEFRLGLARPLQTPGS
jgi:hypothetical protein